MTPREELKPQGSPQRRVMLVEDSPEILETLKLLVEALGHQVDVASDGVDAVTQILGLQPDVALIDVGLPGIDGYEVARRIRAAPEGSGLYLVAVTGHAGPKAVTLAVQAGFDRHIAKPIDVDGLGPLLERPT